MQSGVAWGGAGVRLDVEFGHFSRPQKGLMLTGSRVNRREAAKQNSPGALALGRRDIKRHALKGRPTVGRWTLQSQM